MRVFVIMLISVLTVARSVGASEQKPKATSISLAAPGGEYAEIDTREAINAMQVLNGSNEPEKETMIQSVQRSSDKYPPPAFFALAKALWARGQKEDAIFWFNAGRLRGRFDAARCADVTARQGIDVMVMGMPQELRKAQFDDYEKFKDIIRRVIKWDEETPYHYDHRWINLHGLGAMTVTTDETGKKMVPQLSVPEREWPGLAKKQREQYSSDLNEAIEMVRKARAAK